MIFLSTVSALLVPALSCFRSACGLSPIDSHLPYPNEAPWCCFPAGLPRPIFRPCTSLLMVLLHQLFIYNGFSICLFLFMLIAAFYPEDLAKHC